MREEAWVLGANGSLGRSQGRDPEAEEFLAGSRRTGGQRACSSERGDGAETPLGGWVAAALLTLGRRSDSKLEGSGQGEAERQY